MMKSLREREREREIDRDRWKEKEEEKWGKSYLQGKYLAPKMFP